MTLQINLGPEREVDPKEDELGRDRVGFSESMSDGALYDANHGCWVLGDRAQQERYVIVAFEGVVRQAVEVESIVKTGPKRSAFNGPILQPGHPVYDRYVGKLAPNQGNRNPVSYVDDDDELTGESCRCGCGGTVRGRDFLPGHDQTALHARVRQIGSVAEFLDWFDVVRGTKSLP